MTTSRPPRPEKSSLGADKEKVSIPKVQRIQRPVDHARDTLVDRNDVARMLKISRSTIIRYEKTGILKPVKLNKLSGGRVRYLAKDIVWLRDKS
jgi:predicted DNA-binding transcriptional regulator AlpA